MSNLFLLSFDGKRLIRYFGTDEIVGMDDDIEVICKGAFAVVLNLRKIDIGVKSRLRRIEGLAFTHCRSLESIFLPSFMDTIDGSAFCQSGIREVPISGANHHFMMKGDFLLNYEGTTIIRYFGRNSIVHIDSEIEHISVSAFESCEQIRRIEIEPNSRLKRIDGRAFRKCRMLSSISLPASTECLCSSSFGKCRNLGEVQFEFGSQLNRIEVDSFVGCSSLSAIFVPESVKVNPGLDLSGAESFHIEWY
jgi:hypothetical protein